MSFGQKNHFVFINKKHPSFEKPQNHAFLKEGCHSYIFFPQQGKTMVKTLPFPNSLSTVSVPP